MEKVKESKFFEIMTVCGVVLGFVQNVAIAIISLWNYIYNEAIHSAMFGVLIIFLIVENIILLAYLYICKCKLALIESLENNNRANLTSAIQMFLNKDKNSNRFKISKATLDVFVENRENHYSENDICDMKFKWILEGKNNTNKEIDILNFRLSTCSATSLSELKLQAKQIINEGAGQSKNSEMKVDETKISDKKTQFIIPLIFNKPIHKNDIFKVEVSYVCPNCFIQKQDWLIIAPFNFSRFPLESFEVNVHCDDEIISKDNYYVKLYHLIVNSPVRRELEGESQLEVLNENVFSSKTVNVNSKYIYMVEINRETGLFNAG